MALPRRVLFTILVLLGALPIAITIASQRGIGDEIGSDGGQGLARFLERSDPLIAVLALGGLLLLVPIRLRVPPLLDVRFAAFLYYLVLICTAPFTRAHGTTVSTFAAWGTMAYVWLVGELPLRSLDRVFRLVARAALYGSMACVLVAPGLALVREYDTGFLPWSVRLQGILPHANSLGAVAATSLVMLLRPDAKRNTGWRLLFVAALVALIGSQSKTSIAAFAIVVLARAWPARSLGRARKVRWLVGAAMLIGVAAFAFAVGPLSAGSESRISSADAGETFTGRTGVWSATVTEWRQNRVFGLGSAVWDRQMQDRYEPRLRFRPGQAHNQVVQTIGEAGLFGLGALALLLIALTSASIRSSDPTAIGLLIVLLTRSLLESPLQTGALGVSAFLFVHTVAYIGSARLGAADTPTTQLETVRTV